MEYKWYFKKTAIRQWFSPLRSKRGVSLVEVMASLGISVLLYASVFTVNLMARQTYDFSSTFMDVHGGGTRLSMDRMTSDIRGANQVLSSITITSATYTASDITLPVTHTTADNVLVLDIPSIDSNGDVIVGVSDYVVYYYYDPDNSAPGPWILERIIDADATSSRSDGARMISDEIEGDTDTLKFRSGGTGLSDIGDVTSITKIEVALTAKDTSLSGRDVDDSLNSIIRLRNKIN